jgi:acyl carrier protein
MANHDANEIESTIRRIIASELKVDEREITPDAHLIEDFKADSLDAINVVLAIERQFQIEIPDERIREFMTLKQILAGLYEHLGVCRAQ